MSLFCLSSTKVEFIDIYLDGLGILGFILGNFDCNTNRSVLKSGEILMHNREKKTLPSLEFLSNYFKVFFFCFQFLIFTDYLHLFNFSHLIFKIKFST